MSEQGKSGFGRWKWLTLVALAVFAAGYLAGRGGPERTPPQEQVGTAARHELQDHEPGKATLWTCSMHPQIKLPEPGKCPICFMDLIPLVEETGGTVTSLRQITLSETARKLAQVQTSPVQRRDPTVETRMVGQVEYDETRLGAITAWMSGRIDKLYVDFTGAFVARGQPMAEIYSPELYAAQAELIQAQKSLPELSQSKLEVVRESARRTADSAREKLRLLGLTAAQIRAIEARGAPSDHVALHAPLSGVVIKREVSEGMYVRMGSPIYTIADISRVWVVLEAYESDLPWVGKGREVAFQTDAFPGRTFTGQVVWIDPFMNEKTRTARVRLEAANTDLALKPGMYVRAVQRADAEAAAKSRKEVPLVIPATAPLLTGRRAVVYVAAPDREGVFEGREVVLGPRAGDWYIVKSGLQEGEMVVTRGAFKIDSAVQILAKPSMMNPEPGSGPIGHHQGLASASAAATGAQAPSAAVPAALSAAVRDLSADMEGLGQAVGSADLGRLRQSFKAFYDKARVMDSRELGGDAAMLWRELFMLITNDSLVGSQAATISEARFVFAELTRHMARAMAAFGATAPSGKHPDQAARADFTTVAPAAFKAQLGRTAKAYLQLSAALAADDAAVAAKALDGIAVALGGVDMALLSGEAHVAWMNDLAVMQKSLQVMRANPSSLDGLRAELGAFSAVLAGALRAFGVEDSGPLYELFCPMAYDGAGGVWLQSDQEVRNPYFGPAMGGCGEVRGQITGMAQ